MRIQYIPKIKDSDPDMDKHDKAFDFLIECYSYGNKEWRGIDVFNMYSKCFPPGSTRAKIFDNVRRKAMADGRLPAQAKTRMCKSYNFNWRAILDELSMSSSENRNVHRTSPWSRTRA